MLRNWESHRSLKRTKTVAIVPMPVMMGFSIWKFQGRPGVQVVRLATAAIGTFVVLRIPTRKP